jgi:hypothetical protein
MYFLRQSTSVTVMLGPMVSSDGTGLVSLVMSPQLIRLSKNGASFAAKNLVASNAIHNENAWYSTVLNDTDTNATGILTVAVSMTTALPFWREYTVQAPNQFDRTISGSSGNFDVEQARFLGVDMGSISPVAARSPLNALRALRNRVTTSGSILTVYGENDSTAVWTAALTVNASASLIVESDPA